MFDPTFSRYRHIRFKSTNTYRRYVRKEDELHSAKATADTNNIPAHGPYGALLFRSEWRIKRSAILSRDKCCVICHAKFDLQVHHRQYHFVVRERKFKLPWEYSDNLLITLCSSCHKRGHSKFKVPTINV